MRPKVWSGFATRENQTRSLAGPRVAGCEPVKALQTGHHVLSGLGSGFEPRRTHQIFGSAGAPLGWLTID